MNVSCPSYIEDNNNILYQVYGLIQPSKRILAQVSYVPLKKISKRISKKCKKKIINGEVYVKWTPLIDKIGMESYVNNTRKILEKRVQRCIFSKQLVDIDQVEIRREYPLVNVSDIKLKREDRILIEDFLEEFGLRPNEFKVNSLANYFNRDYGKDIWKHLTNSDFDIFIFSHGKSIELRDKIYQMRVESPERFITLRGTTGELIPHRVFSTMGNKKIEFDFHFFPDIIDNRHSVITDLEDNYNILSIDPIQSMIENVQIVSADYGYSIPQIFGIKSDQECLRGVEHMISYAHRYDFLVQGEISVENSFIINCKNKKYLLINTYGSLQGNQIRKIRRKNE